MARLRQVVLASNSLEAAVERLRDALPLQEPFSDPAVGYFGLRNAVFALDGWFLEIVSPVQEETAAGRLLERRGDDCGYMLMFQVPELHAARAHARAAGVREVFEVTLPDMAEVHLHPADMRGAIVSLSQPNPPGSWRWGGPDWERRAAPVTLHGVTVEVADPDAVGQRWSSIMGSLAGVELVAGAGELGVTEVRIGCAGAMPRSLQFGTVTLEPS